MINTYLFVPGNRPDRFDKACASGCDAVIIDLEDAVPPADKIAARQAVAKWLSPSHQVLLRVNSAGTDWFPGDLELCSSSGVAGVVLPKAEEVAELERIAQVSPNTALFPTIETARGLWNCLALAQARQTQRILFGAIDFQVDLGIKGEGEELHYFRSQLVLISRVARIDSPVDGVSTAIDDVDRLRVESMRARHFGFGGKTCIHPRQIRIVKECFTPSADELAWARRVLAAAEKSSGAAVAVDGNMVDKPVIIRAQEIVDEHEGR